MSLILNIRRRLIPALMFLFLFSYEGNASDTLYMSKAMLPINKGLYLSSPKQIADTTEIVREIKLNEKQYRSISNGNRKDSLASILRRRAELYYLIGNARTALNLLNSARILQERFNTPDEINKTKLSINNDVKRYQQAARKQKLISVGDKVPDFAVAGWIHGQGFESLSKGQVYIVELTAINCVGCRLCIPHLSKLAKEYNWRAKIVSVYVGERDPDDSEDINLKKVANYIRSLKTKVEFDVAVDNQEEHMNFNWLWQAVGAHATPTAIVINRKGIICWIGNPNDQEKMDHALEQVVRTDQYDVNSKERLNNNLLLLMRLNEFRSKNDFHSALGLIDSCIASYKNPTGWLVEKLGLLLEFDEMAGYEYAKTFLTKESYWGIADILIELAMQIRYKFETKKLKAPNWDIALALIERAKEEYRKQSLNLLSGAYQVQAVIAAFKGDYQQAVDAQQEAINFMRKYKPDEYQSCLNNPNCDPNVKLQEYKRRLAEQTQSKK